MRHSNLLFYCLKIINFHEFRDQNAQNTKYIVSVPNKYLKLISENIKLRKSGE